VSKGTHSEAKDLEQMRRRRLAALEACAQEQKIQEEKT
jgi:hypothetical protein